MKNLGLCLLMWAIIPGLAATRLSVEQLRELVTSARAAGMSDQEIASKIAETKLKVRFTASGFPEDLGPQSKDALRILAAESAFLRPSAEDVSGDPAPTPDKQQELLARTRDYTLNYIHNIPDFICTRTTRRYDDSERPWSIPFTYDELRPRDVTSSELTYSRGRESDAPHILDRPTCGDVPEGLTSYGEFGTIIASLFASGTGTRFTWSHWEVLSGRRAAVLSYSIDKARSNYDITWCCWQKGRMKVPEKVTAAYGGEFSVDPDTGAILRITRRAAPPRLFPNHRTDTMVEYQPVEVGGMSYLCPARSVTVAESRSGEQRLPMTVHYVNEMLFTNYHKFVTSSALRFAGSSSVSPSAAVTLLGPLPPVTAIADVGESDCSAEAVSAPLGKTPLAARPLLPPAHPSPDKHFSVLRFSRNGQFVLAQDDSAIIVFTVQPFRVRFRIPAENATAADFTPDSRQVVFISSATHVDRQRLTFVAHAAHVERWSIADRDRTGFTEMSLHTCETLGLSPDGRVVACGDFFGTLQLLDVSTGKPIFRKEKFGREFVGGDTISTWIYGELGSASINFSPDGRFVIITPRNAAGPPIAWDLHERRALSLTGPLKNLRAASFTFVAPDRLLVSRMHYGIWRETWVSSLLAFPSGEVLSRPAVPQGSVSRAADPGFALVRPYEWVATPTQPPVQAVELSTGHTITNETAALDVLGDRYIVERADGELELNEKGRGQRATPAQEESLEQPSAKEPGTPDATTAAPAHQTFLEEALQLATQLSRSLPDYTCVERVTRYRTDIHAVTLWKVQDVVSAEIVRKEGKEDQRRATIDGTPKDPEKTGNRTWSTGDFGAVLADVLAPNSAARVQFRGEARRGEFAALMYSFHIDAEHSRWLVHEGGREIRPARTGTIWFDRVTKRLLRIEFQGVDIPRNFPAETLELAIDYDYVGLDGVKYLVPIHADQAGCRRGVAVCTRNSIEFLNYRGIDDEWDRRKKLLMPQQN